MRIVADVFYKFFLSLFGHSAVRRPSIRIRTSRDPVLNQLETHHTCNCFLFKFSFVVAELSFACSRTIVVLVYFGVLW